MLSLQASSATDVDRTDRAVAGHRNGGVGVGELQRTEHGLTGVRGGRYGEILLARVEGSMAVAEVYSSFPLNECPEDLWQAIDAEKVAADRGCDFALKNGPRYWLMDSIRRGPAGELVLSEFGGIAMVRLATVRIDLGAGAGASAPVGGPMAYRLVRVDRKALFTFGAGRTVFELVDPDGAAYVMQAYCLAVDPTQREETLGTLGGRLSLPAGWRFASRTIDAPLGVDTREQVAVVVQDELQNTYCRYR